MVAKVGSKVKVDYEGRLESGEIFDSSSHGDHSHPLEFEVGSGQVISGFDDAVAGMEVNEEKEISISPEKGYGKHNNEMLKEMPITVLPPLPNGEKPKQGMTLILSTPSGEKFPAKIAKITKTKVTLDLNHPLAGKTLIFKIKLLEVN